MSLGPTVTRTANQTPTMPNQAQGVAGPNSAHQFFSRLKGMPFPVLDAVIYALWSSLRSHQQDRTRQRIDDSVDRPIQV